MEQLPKEMYDEIVKNIQQSQLNAVRLVSKKFNDAIGRYKVYRIRTNSDMKWAIDNGMVISIEEAIKNKVDEIDFKKALEYAYIKRDIGIVKLMTRNEIYLDEGFLGKNIILDIELLMNIWNGNMITYDIHKVIEAVCCKTQDVMYFRFFYDRCYNSGEYYNDKFIDLWIFGACKYGRMDILNLAYNELYYGYHHYKETERRNKSIDDKAAKLFYEAIRILILNNNKKFIDILIKKNSRNWSINYVNIFMDAYGRKILTPDMQKYLIEKFNFNKRDLIKLKKNGINQIKEIDELEESEETEESEESNESEESDD